MNVKTKNISVFLCKFLFDQFFLGSSAEKRVSERVCRRVSRPFRCLPRCPGHRLSWAGAWRSYSGTPEPPCRRYPRNLSLLPPDSPTQVIPGIVKSHYSSFLLMVSSKIGEEETVSRDILCIFWYRYKDIGTERNHSWFQKIIVDSVSILQKSKKI